MDSGISFDEACEATPQALTAGQRENCPGMQSGTYYMQVGLIGAILALAIAGAILMMRKRRAK